MPRSARANVADMKRKIEQHLEKRGKAWGEVKGGQGSIRDVEFVVQYLQLANGGAMPRGSQLQHARRTRAPGRVRSPQGG